MSLSKLSNGLPKGSPKRYWAVLPAGGSGQRFGAATPKLWQPLLGQPVIWHSVYTLINHADIAGICISGQVEQLNHCFAALAKQQQKPILAVSGGNARHRSVRVGLKGLRSLGANADDWVLVHDAARPCLHTADLQALISAEHTHADSTSFSGALLASPVGDSLKQGSMQKGKTAEPPKAIACVDRSALWRAFTPQMFQLGPLLAAIAAAEQSGMEPGDEAAAMQAAGHQPLLINGRSDNLKITWPGDLALAEQILRSHRAPNFAASSAEEP